MTHNLLLCYEQELEKQHNVQNIAENDRRSQRIEGAARTCAETGQLISPLVLAARRATQRTVKFIRWLRHAIRERLAEAAAVARLRDLYAVL